MSHDTLIASRPGAVEWLVASGITPYGPALAAMEARAAAIAAGDAAERIWLVEHAGVITAGTSARATDLLRPAALPVVAAGRGGQYTLHAPGQRVVYIMLDLNRRGRDIRRLVQAMEQWLIAALARIGVAAFRSPIGTGIWTGQPGGERKIGAIGIRVRRGVTFHGAAVNLTTDLALYDAIVPCGIAERGVTRVADILPDQPMRGLMALFDAALLAEAPSFLDAISDDEGA